MSPMCFASTSHTFELITVPFTIMLSKLAPDTMVFNNKMMCIRPSADFNELTAYYNLHREQTDTRTSPTNQSKTSQSATNVKILIFTLPTFQWDILNRDTHLKGIKLVFKLAAMVAFIHDIDHCNNYPTWLPAVVSRLRESLKSSTILNLLAVE